MDYMLLIMIIAMASCMRDTKEQQLEVWKAEVAASEKAFADLAQKESVANAFLAYADENAVLQRIVS